MSVIPTGFWVRSPRRWNIYLNLVEAKRGVKFRHSTRNDSRIRQKLGNGLGALCLLCCVPDTAWSWFLLHKKITILFITLKFFGSFTVVKKCKQTKYTYYRAIYNTSIISTSAITYVKTLFLENAILIYGLKKSVFVINNLVNKIYSMFHF